MTSQPQTRPLLVELLTEELPPKALQRLGQAFADGLRTSLQQQNLLAEACTVRPLATPRRLAAKFDAVLKQAPEQQYTEKLMPAKVGLTPEGEMTPAQGMTGRYAIRLEHDTGVGHLAAWRNYGFCSDGMSDVGYPFEGIVAGPDGSVRAGCCMRVGG